MHTAHTSAPRVPHAVLKSLRETRPAPFWLDAAEAPAPRPALTGADGCDLAVVGAGFTGLWTALLAKEQDPGLDVVVLEAGARRSGQRPQRRHLHGVAHARLRARAPSCSREENERLVELGDENLDAIERTVRELGIDCGWERTGEMEVATAPWQVEACASSTSRSSAAGTPHVAGRGGAPRGDPLAHLSRRPLAPRPAILDPARLAWGLARACEERGVRIFEGTPVTSSGASPAASGCVTPWGVCARAGRCSPPTRSGRCSGGCGCTSCPCTTTR